MCIYDRIKELADARNTKISKIETDIGIGNGIIGKWKKQSPSCDKLLAVADYLNVSLDYLVTGKQPQALPDDEDELLEIYRKLDISGKRQLMGKAYEFLDKKENAPTEDGESEEEEVCAAIPARNMVGNS